jgi:hypothetical protein
MNGEQKPPKPETRRTISMHNKAVYFGTIATLVIAIIGGADAAHRHYRHHVAVYAKDTARCDLDKDYYATHSRWCDGAEKEHLVTIRHRQTFPAVQSFEPTITVRRDPQAPTDTGNSDPFIALQTTADIARGSGFGSAGGSILGWIPGALDLGTQHLASMVARAAQVHTAAAPMRPAVRMAAAPAQHPTRVTTNGGSVYITNSRVTVAQQ